MGNLHDVPFPNDTSVAIENPMWRAPSSNFCQAFFTGVLILGIRSLSAADPELVRMPFEYDKAMLVIVTPQGAGAVRFIESFQKGNETGNGIIGCDYEWRYLELKPDAMEQTGKGCVFAKLVDSKVVHASPEVNCGPITIIWGHQDENWGIAKYDPTEFIVHPVVARSFADGLRDEPFSKRKIDLERFLYRDEESTKAHLAEVYNGPEMPTQHYKLEVAGPIRYDNCTLVVRDASGVATFLFDKAFEQKRDGGEVRFGIGYEYSYISHDGLITKSGHDEVYERYLKDKYEQGRLYLQAGPIHFPWSRGGSEIGWMYYDPTWIQVSSVDQADAKILTQAFRNPSLGLKRDPPKKEGPPFGQQ